MFSAGSLACHVHPTRHSSGTVIVGPSERTNGRKREIMPTVVTSILTGLAVALLEAAIVQLAKSAFARVRVA